VAIIYVCMNLNAAVRLFYCENEEGRELMKNDE
jgi:hypothetical protein